MANEKLFLGNFVPEGNHIDLVPIGDIHAGLREFSLRGNKVKFEKEIKYILKAR